MSQTTSVPHTRGPSRRALLGGAAATLVGTGLAGAPGALPVPRAAAAPTGATFAVVTDTHVNRDRPDRTEALQRVMSHIHSRDPGLLVNCGDITDYGVRHDFELYLSCIPSGLRDRAYQVPGNHEVQWNADALSAYRDVFGQTGFTVDHGGIRLIGLDPLESQEWAWRFGRERLDRLADDLASTPEDTPVVVLNHFPLRLGGRAFVQDSDEFVRLVEQHPVRAIFAGHTHRRDVSQWNGLTQVVGRASKGAPVYLWCTDTTDADGDRVLQVSEVQVPVDGGAVEEPLVAIPLDRPGPGADLRPDGIDTIVRNESVRVRVTLPAAASAAGVYARLDPQGGTATDWLGLTREGQRWTGDVDTSALPPGPHEVIVRCGAVDGISHNSTAAFSLEPGRTRVAWEQQLTAPVHGDIAVDGDRIVVGSLSGRVTALDVGPGAAEPVWSRSVGAVLKAPVFTPDGEAVLIGSADHHLYSLARDTGETRWRTDLGAPVACDPVIGEIDGEPHVLVAVASELCCLDLAGAVRWRADLGGVFTGQAWCDGERVHVGSGNGNAHAVDARTGERLWTRDCTPDRDDPYGRLIYGPWAARVRGLPDAGVLVMTFATAFALDAATGEVRWTVDGLHRGPYTAPTVTEHGVLVFDGKNGSAHLLDPATGAELWTDHTVACSYGSSPILHPDGARVTMVSNPGTLVQFDLRRRTAVAKLQVSHTFTTSTPALFTDGDGRDLLVSVAKDGMLRGVVGLEDGTDR